MKMLTLNKLDGENFWINPLEIVGLERVTDGCGILLTTGTIKLAVESADDVIAMLEAIQP